MRILADENIPAVVDAFEDLGEIRTVPGRSISAADVRDVDVLLVRSVTRADAALLSDSPVRFVGTATIGTDHLDLPWLSQSGITVASAPGSNADSVSSYVAAIIGKLRRDGRLNRPLADLSSGIVGYGNCGSRVARMARALRMDVKICDPPLASTRSHLDLVSLNELSSCDIITVHVPLTGSGEHPTHHLIDAEFMSKLKPGSVIINASRGGVVNEVALLDELKAKRLSAGLDTWVGEPVVNRELLARVAVASPHVAGYSIDGKVRGTAMLREALIDWLEAQNAERSRQTWDPYATVLSKEASELRLEVPQDEAAEEAFLLELIESVVQIETDHESMMGLMEVNDEAMAMGFDRLRKSYRARREFTAYRVRPKSDSQAFPPRLAEQICELGFKV